MRTEKEKMLAGELYNAADSELFEARQIARRLLLQYNASGPDQISLRQQLLAALLGKQVSDLIIEPPFAVDYGTNISVGSRVYFNFGAVILDVASITIGDDVLFGPGVHLYAATHPVDWSVRQSGLELGKPISIGSNAWIGGGSIICPGVTIGERTIIGAGSVVTRNIPADVVAAGNPCRVIRNLSE